MLHHLTNHCSKFTVKEILRRHVQQQISPTRKKSITSNQVCYQYLHKSKLPTLYFQQSLPRLPIPLLEKTCERYLAALEPILTSEQLEQTKISVSEFKKGIGSDLQALLKKSDSENKHTSYISEPWFDMYLSDRSPLPLNYNPLIVMRHDQKPEYNNQLIRAANLVVSSLRFMRSLQANLLEPEVFHLNPAKSDTDQFRQITKLVPRSIATYVAYAFKAFPLDMSQYSHLFGVTRVPQIDKDRINHAPDSRHILVLRGGNFYAVDVLNTDYDIESPNVILGRLKVVIDENPTGEIKNKHPLGLMTTANRDDWAKTRQYIVDIGNTSQMELVDSALFCLCLDGQDVKYDESKPVKLLKHFLAGDGINRWFDKSVSILVGGDGTAAINFEHSWGDGVAVLRFFNEIYKETIEAPHIHPNTIPYLSSSDDNSVRLIDFNVDDRLINDISDAARKHMNTVNRLDMDVIRYGGGINKPFCKRNGVSPDSIMQLAFQLAYRQVFGDYVGTYESCSTAAFRHGRTETMRPCTMATKAFCESILEPTNTKPDTSELRAMIKNCSTVHGQLTKDAAMGQGFDRHLFGLRHIAQKNGIEVPKLYYEEAYKKINYNIISTSTLSSPAVLAGSFGPVVFDGLGIGYSIQDDECGAIVTSYKEGCSGKTFVDSLDSAFTTIRDILENN